MAKHEQSRPGETRQEEEKDRPSAADKAVAKGDGPGKIGLNSDAQPDLVSPSGVNQRDHGVADDKPMGGGSLNFEDGDMAHPYGNTSRRGGTWDDKNPSDAGELGSPNVGMTDNNGPSDPDAKRTR